MCRRSVVDPSLDQAKLSVSRLLDYARPERAVPNGPKILDGAARLHSVQAETLKRTCRGAGNVTWG